MIRDLLEIHPWLFNYRRVRLLNLMGKMPRDALTADPVALRWIPVLVGAVDGRQPNVEHLVHHEIGGVMPEPDWMHPDEHNAWLKKLAAMVPEKAEARLLLRQYLDEAIEEAAQQFKDILVLKHSRRAVALRRARIDLTADGQSILNYRLGTDRTFQGVMRRLEAMQRPKAARRPKTSAATVGSSDEEDGVEPSGPEVSAVTTEAREAVGGEGPCMDSGAVDASPPEPEPEAVFLTTQAKPADPTAPVTAAAPTTETPSQPELAPDPARLERKQASPRDWMRSPYAHLFPPGTFKSSGTAARRRRGSDDPQEESSRAPPGAGP
jgi:hypothetical protein